MQNAITISFETLPDLFWELQKHIIQVVRLPKPLLGHGRKPRLENESLSFSDQSWSYLERDMGESQLAGGSFCCFASYGLGVRKMKKFLKIALIGFIGFVVLVVVFGSKSSGNKQSGGSVSESTTSKSQLMEQNNPNIKKLNFATADYVGKEFDLYVMAGPADYYNYGFRNENKYYSFVIWDNSVDGQYSGTYAYLDKTNKELKGEELLNLLLKESKFLKVHVAIPVENYQEGSNSFLVIKSWQEI